MPKAILIQDSRCFIEEHEYNYGGRTALNLVCDDGLPYCVVTLNEPTIPLGNDELIIKTRDGQEPAFRALVAAGILSEPARYVRLGYVEEPIVKLNSAVLKEYLEGEDAPSDMAVDDDDDDGDFVAYGPEGLPIGPSGYKTEEDARAALAEWVKRFQTQGYYSMPGRRIPYNEILDHCSVSE